MRKDREMGMPGSGDMSWNIIVPGIMLFPPNGSGSTEAAPGGERSEQGQEQTECFVEGERGNFSGMTPETVSCRDVEGCLRQNKRGCHTIRGDCPLGN